MPDENKIEEVVSAEKTRRNALKTAAAVAVTAPAVAVLLSAPAKAELTYKPVTVVSEDDGNGPTTADDFVNGTSDDGQFGGDDLFTI